VTFRQSSDVWVVRLSVSPSILLHRIDCDHRAGSYPSLRRRKGVVTGGWNGTSSRGGWMNSWPCSIVFYGDPRCLVSRQQRNFHRTPSCTRRRIIPAVRSSNVRSSIRGSRVPWLLGSRDCIKSSSYSSSGLRQVKCTCILERNKTTKGLFLIADEGGLEQS